MKKNPKVAITIIQAHEKIDDLLECLNSLNEIAYDNFYVILINNNVKNLDLK